MQGLGACAELSLTFDSIKALDDAIDCMGLILQELPRPALFLAGMAFVKCRREGRTKGNVLAEFFIGAHAAVLGCSILTRDGRCYRNYFPRVALIAPQEGRSDGDSAVVSIEVKALPCD